MSNTAGNLDDALDIYVPGCWICPKCHFALCSQTLFVNSGDVGCTREQVMNLTGECCPNDGEPMRRETWHGRAESNYKWGLSLMEDIIAATGTDNLPDALAKLKAPALPPPAEPAQKLDAMIESVSALGRIVNGQAAAEHFTAAEPAEPQTPKGGDHLRAVVEQIKRQECGCQVCDIHVHDYIALADAYGEREAELTLLRQQVETLTAENEKLKVLRNVGQVALQKMSDIATSHFHAKEAAEAERDTLKAENVALRNECTRLLDEERCRWYRALSWVGDLEGLAPEIAAQKAKDAAEARLAALPEQIGNVTRYTKRGGDLKSDPLGGWIHFSDVLQVIDDARTT